jgi:hypothetical protein
MKTTLENASAPLRIHLSDKGEAMNGYGGAINASHENGWNQSPHCQL